MLLNDFYSFEKVHHIDGKVEATITFQPNHAIFAGHFPGQPVVPGVCLVQAVKDLLSIAIVQKLALEKAANIKFLAVIIPNQLPGIALQINYQTLLHQVEVQATLHQEAKVCFKMNATFGMRTSA